MTTFTSEDRKNAYDTPTVIVDNGASPVPPISAEHLEEFIKFGKDFFAQGSLLFGTEFLKDAIRIAEELLQTKGRK